MTRGKVQFQKNKNEMKTTNNLNNKQIPDINKNSQRYYRVKTELIERTSTNRLFNNSKLSNISDDFIKPKINFNDYKMIRINFKVGPKSLQRVPSLQSTSFQKPKNNNLTMKNKIELKNYVTNRIKT